jgi:hypothetical protein
MASPRGLPFSAKFSGHRKSFNVTAPTFKIPYIDGVYIDPQGTEGEMLSYDFVFTGDDCDILSQAFFAECEQTGTWTITHGEVIEGVSRNLVLVSVGQKVDLVKSGGIAVVDCRFMTTLDLLDILGGGLLSGLANIANAAFAGVAAVNFAGTLATEAAGALDRVRSAGSILGDLTLSLLTPVVSGFDDLRDSLDSAYRDLSANLSSTEFSPEDMINQIVAMMGAAAGSESTVEDYEEAYGSMIGRSVGEAERIASLGRGDDAAKNELLTYDIYGHLAVSTLSSLGAASEFISRAEALGFIERTTAAHIITGQTFDAAMGMFTGRSIDRRYVSLAQWYEYVRSSVYASVRSIYDNALSLPFEKRKSFPVKKTPVEIVVSEYGDLGTSGNEENLDRFFDLNDLGGLDQYLVPAGREVVLLAGVAG